MNQPAKRFDTAQMWNAVDLAKLWSCHLNLHDWVVHLLHAILEQQWPIGIIMNRYQGLPTVADLTIITYDINHANEIPP